MDGYKGRFTTGCLMTDNLWQPNNKMLHSIKYFPYNDGKSQTRNQRRGRWGTSPPPPSVLTKKFRSWATLNKNQECTRLYNKIWISPLHLNKKSASSNFSPTLWYKLLENKHPVVSGGHALSRNVTFSDWSFQWKAYCWIWFGRSCKCEQTFIY